MTAPNPYLPRALAGLRDEIRSRIIRLATARTWLKEVDGEIETREQALYASPDMQKLVARQNELEAQSKLLEQELRGLVVDHYNADPEMSKKPVVGVGIRETKQAVFDVATAEAWAKEKGLFMKPATLDIKALEKFLLTGPTDIGLTYAIQVVPQASVSPELDEAARVAALTAAELTPADQMASANEFVAVDEALNPTPLPTATPPFDFDGLAVSRSASPSEQPTIHIHRGNEPAEGAE